MSPPRDDHDYGASIAGIQADVRRIDDVLDREHEFIESVNRKNQETSRTVQEIEVAQATMSGQVKTICGEQKKGSERMRVIDERVTGIEHWQLRSMGWIGGASFAAAIIGALIGKLMGL